MITWLVLLFLIGAGEPPCEGERPAPRPAVDPHIEQIVLGKRHDLEVEVKERLAYLADLSAEVLRAREAFLGRAQARLEHAAATDDLIARARARAHALDARLADLEGPHPVCAYLIEGSGGHKLRAQARPVLDHLRAARASAPPTVDETCARPELAGHPPASLLCRVALTGEVDACQGTELEPYCEGLADPWPDSAELVVHRDAWFTFVWAHALRTDDRSRCQSTRTPWIARMCSAVATQDVSRCPPWTDWTRPGGHISLTELPHQLAADLDLVVDIEPAGPDGRCWVTAVVRRPILCRSYVRGDDGAWRTLDEAEVTPEGSALARFSLLTRASGRAPAEVRCALWLPDGRQALGEAP